LSFSLRDEGCVPGVIALRSALPDAGLFLRDFGEVLTHALLKAALASVKEWLDHAKLKKPTLRIASLTLHA
jgi:hypothetical protein